MEPVICFFHALCFVPPNLTTSGMKIFGFSEFLASLALLVVVFTVTDIRYKFRISIAPVPLYKITFFVIALAGLISLITDIWSSAKWWVLDTNFEIKITIQATLGLSFLTCFMLWVYYAFLAPPIFGKRNSEKYFNALYKYIVKGIDSELAIVCDELSRSANSLIKFAGDGEKRVTGTANDILYLIGNRNFCRVLVATSPQTAAYLFAATTRYNKYRIPLHQFSANISQEAINNKNSIIYHEDDGYHSGFLGHFQEWSKTIYGNYLLVEELNRGHLSPLNFSYKCFMKFDSEQWEAYFRGALIYLENKLKNDNFLDTHCALNSIFENIKMCTQQTYLIDSLEDSIAKNEIISKLSASITFINNFIKLTSKFKTKSFYEYSVKDRKRLIFDIHYFVSDVLIELIFNASQCQSNNFTTWHIQNNIVWNGIFSIPEGMDGNFYKKTKKKLIRKMYDEIKDITRRANFKNARIAGLILNVLGLKTEPNYFIRKDKELIFIQKITQNIIKENFIRIVKDQPQVADSMLPKNITFDQDKNCLIKTYSVGINKEAPKEYLYLD
ncbi:hypothetical protein [Pectobacterium carotovorum]|uniref:hypothetical protein n=1 Tax=Pectobacterium carotovorum TaxID=554 RepID=UPI000689A8AB|nr:hypothetical protein [Pectobacterium carotovorum]QRN37109.1 hypothetical protein IHJ55_14595 [Pectobacterium carotovorum]